MSSNENSEMSPPDFKEDDDDKGDGLMFESVMAPPSMEISLTDDFVTEDDENPFGEPPVRQKTETTTTNDVEVVTSQLETEEPIVHNQIYPKIEIETSVPIHFPINTAPEVSTETEISTSIPDDLSPFAAEQEVTPTPPVVKVTPIRPAPTPPTTPPLLVSKPVLDNATSVIQLTSKNLTSEGIQTKPADIEISVSDPFKVGDGMSSYMSYRLTTKSTLPIFKSTEFTVNRRFSDFLGLHVKLANKHVTKGILIPMPPEKDSISMARVKISKDEGIPTDFLDRRRAMLERYLNRLVKHPKLLEDPDVREFIELSQDLPKSTNTQALSGAGVLRAFSSITDQVAKLTTKTSEQDQWFEEKYTSMIEIQKRLKYLYNQMNAIFGQRKEAAYSLKSLSAFLGHLASTEEHALLSSALIEMGNVQEKFEQNINQFSLKENAILTELVKEYIAMLDMVQATFHERIHLHQVWLHAEETLRKKRDNKTKLEQTPKGGNKLPQAELEIQEWEQKVEKSKYDFEQITLNLKYEIEVFEENRFGDFQQSIVQYLNAALAQQERILQIWEGFLPEANKVVV